MIINFTPTGMIPAKEMTPHVPIEPNEIIDQVLEAYAIGITIVHLHAKDKQGKNDPSPETFAKIINGIRSYAPELIISVTTSGREYKSFEERTAVLELTGKSKPDLASLTLSSVNFNKNASINEPDMIKKIAKKMKEKKILPELEIFDIGMVNYAKHLLTKGLIKAPHYANIILGNISCAQADLLHLGVLASTLPEQTFFSIGGVGRSQLKAMMMGITHANGVRVGLEDNIWYDEKRSILATNKDLLDRVHVICKLYEKVIMKPSLLREKLGLNSNGEYGLR